MKTMLKNYNKITICLKTMWHESLSFVFHSLVMPCLDYCNATLACLSTSQLRRLQSVLNAAARLIHRSPRYEHVTSMLRDLHWLWSLERVDFKLDMFVYRCMQGLAPRYLSDHIQLVIDSNRRRLQSSSSDVHGCLLSEIMCFRWLEAAFVTVCHLMSSQLLRWLFFGTASKLISFSS